MSLVGIFENEKFEFPLKKTDVFCNVVDNVAVVELNQIYFNNSNKTVNSNYIFPLYHNAVVSDFIINFSHGKIVATVEEKKAAKEKFENAVSTGKQAVIMDEQNKEQYDLTIGNIDASETVEVCITYFVHLERDLDTDGHKFVLPTTITPRYDNSKTTMKPDWDMPVVKNPPSLYNRSYEGDKVGSAWSNKEDKDNHEEERPSNLKKPAEMSPIIYSEYSTDAPINMKVRVRNTKKIMDLKIPKWNGKLVKRTHDGFNADFDVDNIELGKDYNFIIVPSESRKNLTNKSFAVYENDSDDMYIKIELDEDSVFTKKSDGKFEFIFVLDRSGSMQGEPIKNSKRALAHLLNSLPMDCYFNIYGFGNTWKRFYPKSTKYNQETFIESKKIIDNIDADMGGTDLNIALEAVFNSDKIPLYERRIILLTDGEVWDLKSVFEQVIKENTPIFTIGVGLGVSHELVNGLAEKTNGACEIISDFDLIEKKVLQQLKRSMYSESFLTIEDKTFSLRPGQEFILFKLSKSSLNLMNNEKDLTFLDVTKEYDDVLEVQRLPMHQLNLDKSVLKLQWADEELKKMMNVMESVELSVVKSTLEKEIINFCLKHSLISEFTSLVGILEHENDENRKIATNVIVNPLHPGKYSQKNLLLKKRKFYNKLSPFPTRKNVNVRSSTPFSMNMSNNYDDDDDDDDEEEEEEEDDDEAPLLQETGYEPEISGENKKEKKIHIADDFEFVMAKFAQAFNYDGSVSWETVRKLLRGIPFAVSVDNSITCDDWTTFVMLAYFFMFALDDDKEDWEMTIEKSSSMLKKKFNIDYDNILMKASDKVKKRIDNYVHNVEDSSIEDEKDEVFEKDDNDNDSCSEDDYSE